MEYCRKIFVISFFILLIMLTPAQALDAEKNGPVYGDPEGLARVEKLEQQLHNMKVIEQQEKDGEGALCHVPDRLRCVREGPRTNVPEAGRDRSV